MSALGHKQTLRRVRPTSALPPKADINPRNLNVRFVPIRDRSKRPGIGVDLLSEGAGAECRLPRRVAAILPGTLRDLHSPKSMGALLWLIWKAGS
jgi:hypothetical protein